MLIALNFSYSHQGSPQPVLLWLGAIVELTPAIIKKMPCNSKFLLN